MNPHHHLALGLSCLLVLAACKSPAGNVEEGQAKAPAQGSAAPAAAPATPPVAAPVAAPAAPTPVPDEAEALGFDVSKYQPKVDWAAARAAGRSFVFIKATESTSHVDPLFTEHWAGAAAAGLVRGAYHFYRPEADATAQAELFVKTVKLEPGDLPPVLDVEVLDGRTAQQVVEGVKVWLAHVEKAMGRRPVVYSYTSFIQQYLKDSLAEYPLWVAVYEKQVPKAEANWLFWQYGVDGASWAQGCVDENRFSGTVADLRNFARQGVLPARRIPPPAGAKVPQCARPTESTEARKPAPQASSAQ